MEQQLLAELNGIVETESIQQDGVFAPVNRLNFSDPTQREAHLKAFLAWLPKPLHQAPEMHWDCLPSKVMGYLILSVADGPDAIPIALAVGCAMNGVKNSSLSKYCSQLTCLLKRLRARYGLRELTQLGMRSIWDQFVAGRALSLGELASLRHYDSLASLHVRSYLEGLDIRQRAIWEQYALPPLPAGFIEKQRQHKAALAATQQRRKEQSDVLVPLFPLLVEIAQLRKQAMERLVREFRKLRDRAIAGEIELPYHFEYTDRSFAVSEDAPTLAEVGLIEREVTLAFSLWDRVRWVQDHPERYSDATRKTAERRQGAYAPERNSYFLQFNGQAGDLLWCGEIIRDRRLGTVTSSKGTRVKEFYASRPGLLTPTLGESVWLNYALRSGEMLLDPESLYKGVLFATALATLALTNGSRLNELLQVSAERFDTLVVDELKDQQPTGRKIGILVQKLLPKGSRQEHERQFFLVGEMAGRLLTEIGQLLEVTHGGTIPVVHPYRSSKEEDLGPEPYLFQWAAEDNGRLGVLNPDDVGSLLRFLFHGLTLMTRTGKPIRVAAHLLRHVLATHARTVKKVPAEAVAYLLHHRVVLPDSTRALTISEATAYYSRLPLEQLLALLYEAQSQLSRHHPPSYLQVPPPRTLEQMDAALRQIFEQWGTIGPTVFGYCSAGLCVRPNNRALCLDCQYLVPHYSNLRNARTWRKLYVLQAQLHDAHGHSVDAKQSRQMIQYIDDIIRVMEIQIRTRQDAGMLPFADTLPPAQNDEGDGQ
jgi:hypothetical protein